jgi:hypothetical protein
VYFQGKWQRRNQSWFWESEVISFPKDYFLSWNLKDGYSLIFSRTLNCLNMVHKSCFGPVWEYSLFTLFWQVWISRRIGWWVTEEPAGVSCRQTWQRGGQEAPGWGCWCKARLKEGQLPQGCGSVHLDQCSLLRAQRPAKTSSSTWSGFKDKHDLTKTCC